MPGKWPHAPVWRAWAGISLPEDNLYARRSGGARTNIASSGSEVAMDALISEEALLDWLGYSRRADALRWMDEQGVGYWLGKGGRLCTTQAAVDAAIIRIAQESNSRKRRYAPVDFS
ncbi:hypothetical protein JKG47_21535 [Acidithiobacillus sp. MC6.1]|nr:hypothetical protein [Acidithiobacillus sp. MC6.1]